MSIKTGSVLRDFDCFKAPDLRRIIPTKIDGAILTNISHQYPFLLDMYSEASIPKKHGTANVRRIQQRTRAPYEMPSCPWRGHGSRRIPKTTALEMPVLYGKIIKIAIAAAEYTAATKPISAMKSRICDEVPTKPISEMFVPSSHRHKYAIPNSGAIAAILR